LGVKYKTFWMRYAKGFPLEELMRGNRPPNQFGERGIGFRCGNYTAAVTINGKKKHLGTFATPQLAVKAVRSARCAVWDVDGGFGSK